MVKSVQQEIRSTPRVSAASPDPPPTSSGKSLFITRKVRVTKVLVSGLATITVDDVKGESSSSAFKVMGISAWAVGCGQGLFTLGDSAWANDGSLTMKYNDIAPLTRLPGVKFNIPDVLAEIMNAGALPVISVAVTGPTQTASQLCADVTIRYQI